MTSDVSKNRTHNYLLQIKGAVVYKAVAMLASFLALPLMISYLGQEQFGVWSTLLSIMSWIVLFDLGVGNGLRNKVAETLANNDTKAAAHYISFGYSLIGIIAFIVWLILTITTYFIPWQTVFNTDIITEKTLRFTVQMAVFFIVINFWIGLINALISAIQKTACTALGQLITNSLALLFVFILTKLTDSSITNLAMTYGISLLVSNIGLSWWFYRLRPALRPSLNFKKGYFKPLLSVGLQFFVIQVAVLVIFTSDKILITQLFGFGYVTQYDVVSKLFGLIAFFHALILAPLWSAYTEAFQKDDFLWIKAILIKQLWIFLGVIILVVIMSQIAKSIIALWIGNDIFVTQSLIISISIFIIICAWNNIFATFVNGIGIIKLQLLTSLVAMLLNIPLSIILVKFFGFGVSGVVVGTIVSLSIAAVALPLQTIFIINKNKTIAEL